MTETSITVPIDCRYRHSATFGDGDPIVTNGGEFFTRTATLDNGEKIPNYRKVISEGGCATTNLYFSGYEYSQEPSYHRMHCFRTSNGSDKRTYVNEGNVIEVAFPSTVHSMSTTNATNQALIAFYQHLNQVDTSFKGMVFGGEFVQTLRMIRRPFRSLRRGIDDYLDYVGNVGRRLPKQQRPSFVRRTWLEYSYGWAPLISDCGNAVDAFYASQIVRPVHQMVRGRGRETLVGSETAMPLIAPVLSQSTSGRVLNTSEVDAKFYGVYSSVGTGLARDAANWGFRPSEFVPTIWELIPYSFLVDYFSNIGKVIESWSYRNIGAKWISKTLVQKNTKVYFGLKTAHLKTLGNSYTYEHQSKPGSAIVTHKIINRDRNAGQPLPSFGVKVPGKWYQWVNIAALSANHRRAVTKLQS